MNKTIFLLLVVLGSVVLAAEQTDPVTAQITKQDGSDSKKDVPSRALDDERKPYFTNHVIHHQPYYQGGWGPYHVYGPMMMVPPSPMVAMPPMVPPPPPMFGPNEIPIKNAYHVIHYPHHMPSPFNTHAYGGFAAMGNNPMFGAALAPYSHMAGAFGPFGQGNPFGSQTARQMQGEQPMQNEQMMEGNPMQNEQMMEGNPMQAQQMPDGRRMLVDLDEGKDKLEEDKDRLVEDFRKQLESLLL